jgi:flagellar biosynthetic protein FlhB
MAEEKTESPTARRLQRARAQGRVAFSREVTIFAGLTAGLAVVLAQLQVGSVAAWFDAALRQSRYLGAPTWHGFGRTLAASALLPALASSAAAWASGLLQTGFLLQLASLQPDPARISPLSGLKRMFGTHALVQALKSVGKLGLLGFCLYVAILRLLPRLPVLPLLPPSRILSTVRDGGVVLLLLLGAQAAIAAADLLWERIHFARQQRMSVQEVKDEHKDTEGNPQVRQRLRQLARLRARRRMMKAVPKAAVVITNPTHYAVALSYQRGAQGAPRVVAKGADEVARRIRELARAHHVPMVANPVLAQGLFRIDIDTEIPPEHFRAVAEIIAYVWRMRARAGRQ